jgi:hypothetical protein
MDVSIRLAKRLHDALGRCTIFEIFNARNSRSMICTAISLATSPAACPPMPSATTNKTAIAIRADREVVFVAGPDHADVVRAE